MAVFVHAVVIDRADLIALRDPARNAFCVVTGCAA